MTDTPARNRRCRRLSRARGPGRIRQWTAPLFAAGLVATAALAGCATGPSGTTAETAEPKPPRVHSLWISSRTVGRAAAYIEVTTTHRSRYNRVIRVALVSPDGLEVAAEDTRHDEVPVGHYRHPYYGPWGSFGIFSGGYRRRVGVGIGIGFPIGGPWGGYRLYRTRATIKTPSAYQQADLAARSGWKIKVTFEHAKRGLHARTRPAPPGK